MKTDRGDVFYDVTKIKNATNGKIDQYGMNPQAESAGNVSNNSLAPDTKNVNGGQKFIRNESFESMLKRYGAIPQDQTATQKAFVAEMRKQINYDKNKKTYVPPKPKSDGKDPAQVLLKRELDTPTFKERLREQVDYLKRKVVDVGATVATVGKLAGDSKLYEYYNHALQASRAGHFAVGGVSAGTFGKTHIVGQQTDYMGRRVGDSLYAIFDPVKKKGAEYEHAFSLYLFHNHNVDRMSLELLADAQTKVDAFNQFLKDNPGMAEKGRQAWVNVAKKGDELAQEYLRLDAEAELAMQTRNKPVFGDEVTAEDSRKAVAELEAEHPEFAQLAEKVYGYTKNLMRFRVDTGLVSQEMAGLMQKTYPHYVPTFRKVSGTRGAGEFGRRVSINKTVRRAKGSNLDLMPIAESLARQTMQVASAGHKNLFGQRFLDVTLKNADDLGEYIYAVDESEGQRPNIETEGAPEAKGEKKKKADTAGTFTVYRNGEPVTMQLNTGLYDGVSALAPAYDETAERLRWAAKINNTFKALVTSYNPIFMIRNPVRDFQDVVLYSKNLRGFGAALPKAVKEIFKNGARWQQYQALGGFNSSYFDLDKGFVKESNAFKRNTLDRIESANVVIEQLPRFTEFLSTVNRKGDSYDALMEAMHNAADVTVNFGRAGTLTKKLNRTFVPFLNPSVQGMSKTTRLFTETKGLGRYIALGAKIAIFGVGLRFLNDFLLGDDEEYAELPDRVKDQSYVFKTGGKMYIIPRGRLLSVFGTVADVARDLVEGNDQNVGERLKNAWGQMAPNNPLEDNILAPVTAVTINRTWYGSPIESQRLDKYAPGQRYDETTDNVSKAIGGALNVSPKKINYLIDAYTGVVGDFVLPLLTPKAETNPFAKAFTVDPALTNRTGDDFRRAMEKRT